ncbi:MAG: response regulator transcription factor [Pseudomonadales bacterium]|nr:response regulator transcription factor [Pseudomonadales bacterium]MCP5184112.1 response regulator transcription factor [Pseudomonadales bacterium]
MRVLIVDDEALARDRLRRLLDAIGGYECVGEAGNGRDAVELVGTLRPDLVLLDIRMPGMDGLEAAAHLTRLEEPPAVVFCTAYEEHAIQAFDLQAVGYLLKPVRRDRLEATLTNTRRVNRAQIQALGQLEEAARRTHLSARTHRGLELVPVDEIRYLRADSKYVTVRHGGGEVLVDEALRDLEVEFSDVFVRVHRNALAAHRYIVAVEKSSDGQHHMRLRDVEETLDISRRHLPGVRRLVKTL